MEKVVVAVNVLVLRDGVGCVGERVMFDMVRVFGPIEAVDVAVGSTDGVRLLDGGELDGESDLVDELDFPFGDRVGVAEAVPCPIETVIVLDVVGVGGGVRVVVFDSVILAKGLVTVGEAPPRDSDSDSSILRDSVAVCESNVLLCGAVGDMVHSLSSDNVVVFDTLTVMEGRDRLGAVAVRWNEKLLESDLVLSSTVSVAVRDSVCIEVKVDVGDVMWVAVAVT